MENLENLENLEKRAGAILLDYGKTILLLALLVLLVFVCFESFRAITPSKLKISFLDVGQGDAILVVTPSGKQMLIDGGSTNQILEELSDQLSYFDTTLDAVVATHPDSDHVTGLIPVLKKFTVATVVASNVKGTTGIFGDLTEKIELETRDIHIAKKGDVIDFGDGVEVYILHPNQSIERETNEGSVSMLIKYGNNSFLLTGDLSEKNEPLLVDSSLPQHVTVYKAGHHGSKTSSGRVLLSYIKPEYAVISAGKNNSYGHPHRDTLDRLGSFSKEILSTIDRGTITFISDGKLLEVVTEK